MKGQRCKMMMKLFLLYIVVINMVITTAAVTTNNRILLSSVLVGTALVASVSGSYEFGFTDLALLTTAVLVTNFPRNQQATQYPCSAPGYTVDPLLGCYRIIRLDTTRRVTKDQAKQQCANDGGRLLLINSEAEANELRDKLYEGLNPVPAIVTAFIQGNRQDPSSPWVADDGSPLPYLPSKVTSSGTTIVFYASKSGFVYDAARPDVALNTIVCEIGTQ